MSLAEQIAQACARGGLKPGDQLPPQRKLADEVGLSLPTVSRAYEELARRGLVTGETGRGTFVCNPKSGSALSPIVERVGGSIDLSILRPVCDEIHSDHMRSALRAVALDVPVEVVCGARPSDAPRRQYSAAVEWLRICGVRADERSLILTNGGIPALSVAFMSVCQHGSTIVTEELGLHVLLPLASYIGVKVRAVCIDENGIIPEALEDVCREVDVRALFLMPNALSPTGFIMDESRRHAIVEIARRYNVDIVENDALGPLFASKPPAFQVLAPERTLYVTSLTKPVMPGLRVGYLAAPERLLAAVERTHLMTSWIATPLMAEIATRWIYDGTCTELLGWQWSALNRRFDIASEILDGMPCSGSRGGLHLWLPLPYGVLEETFVSNARHRGVTVAGGASFAHSPRKAAVRISTGSTNEPDLRRGLSVIRDLHLGRSGASDLR